VLKRILEALLLICLSASIAQAAGAPFIGTWKLDPSKTRLPDRMKVEKRGANTFAFDFGGGAETIVLDGTYQKGVQGTLLSVKAEAPGRWIVERQMDGRLLVRATWSLSKDGRRLIDDFRQFGADGATSGTDSVYQRAGRGSGFAGVWESVKETMISPPVMQVTAFKGDGLSFVTSPTLLTRSAKFDGADYPDEGANARPGATSSIRRVDARTLAVTRKYDGKAVATEDFALSTDLKTLTITQHIPGRDKPNVYVFQRT
jgi:hypothetical protein